MNAKPYISASQLQMYQRCGEQYRRRHIEGEKVPPGIAAHKGRGVHSGAQAEFGYKLERKADLPREDIVEVAVMSFEQSVAEGVMLTPEEQGRGKDIVVGEAKDGVVTLAGLFADEVAPVYSPALVECQHTLAMPECSHDLLGILDLADTDRRVIDLKTGSRRKPQTDADKSEQLTFYALLYGDMTGDLPAELRLECLIEKKQPERQMLVTTRTTPDIGALAARLDAMLRGLEAGTFIPAPATSWGCDPRWCGYYQTCKFVGRR